MAGMCDITSSCHVFICVYIRQKPAAKMLWDVRESPLTSRGDGAFSDAFVNVWMDFCTHIQSAQATVIFKPAQLTFIFFGCQISVS